MVGYLIDLHDIAGHGDIPYYDDRSRSFNYLHWEINQSHPILLLHCSEICKFDGAAGEKGFKCRCGTFFANTWFFCGSSSNTQEMI